VIPTRGVRHATRYLPLLAAACTACVLALLAASGAGAQDPPAPANLSGTGDAYGNSDQHPGVRFRHVVRLYCDRNTGENTLTVTWGSRDDRDEHEFVLQDTIEAGCSDSPFHDPGDPPAGFDTHQGYGTGTYDGQPGYTFEWAFIDDGEPARRRDGQLWALRDPDEKVVITFNRIIGRGNYEAQETPKDPLLPPADNNPDQPGFSNTPGSGDLGPDDPGPKPDCVEEIIGTQKADNLTGTAAGERIKALGQNDTVAARGGNDCVAGGRGDDRLSGGGGNDLLNGGSRNDRLRGKGGEDRLRGRAGRDFLNGGAGNDRLNGGKGRDRLFAKAGQNVLRAGAGADFVGAANGVSDRVACGRGNDRVKADEADILKGCETISLAG
jgi:Ca2+-binding RTX toxin-like protein